MSTDGYLLGFDVGSSSIKAALLEARTGALAGSATCPKTELAIEAKRPGWAEQDPAVWWNLAAAFTFMLGLVLPVNLFGDALRDALDPRLKTR